MKYTIFIAFALCIAFTSAIATSRGFVVQDKIDLNALVKIGTYYNILSKPDAVDKLCHCTQAVYTWISPNQRLGLLESCHLFRPKGPYISENSELQTKVLASNALLTRYDFNGFVQSNYAIVQAAVDYSWIAVADPNLKHFWLLANTPTLDQDTVNDILSNQGKVNGFDFSDALYTDQSCFTL